MVGLSSLMVLAVEAGESGAPAWLTETVALVVAGAAIAYLCQRLGIVPIVGFLLAGVVIGPNALGLVRSQEVVDRAAEIGVILLLFTIGLEFSIGRLLSIKRLILGAGGTQVGLAVAAVTGALLWAGQPWQVGVYTGFLVALSSTAIVLKLNSDRGLTNAPQGQVALGLLLFQDLAVVVMVLLVPMLGGAGGSSLELARALAIAVALIAVVLIFARRLMPPLLENVARICSPEVFLLAVVAICLGTAFITSLAGVSVSLGAFLAGLIVSESKFSGQVFGEILPLQILFSATFFVSVGMLLDVGFLIANLPLVALAVGAVLLVKVVTTFAAAFAFGYPLPVATAAALTLAQIGEFSFVLERTGSSAGLTPAGLDETGSQTFIAATVLLMVATPLLARMGELGAGRMPAKPQPSLEPDRPADPERDGQPSGHVIVAGYGQGARMIVDVLDRTRIQHVVTTLSPGGAEEAESAGHHVIRGDASRQMTLLAAGMDRANVLVVADDDPAVAERTAQIARQLNSSASIVVRTRHNVEADPLAAAGADHVVTAEHASAAALTDKVLRAYDLGDDQIHEQILRLWLARNRAMLGRPERLAEDVTVRTRRLSSTGNALDIEEIHRLDATSSRCSHLSRTHPVLPSSPGCDECLELDEAWVHLRICAFCGHVGCCDSSPGRHASKHATLGDHPVMMSGERDEQWGWCYTDELRV